MKFRTTDGVEFEAEDHEHAMAKVLNWNGISIEEVK